MLRDLKPTDNILGFDVRPGYYDMDGATPVRGGVNFTISSFYATSCTLLLFYPGSKWPYARIPFPDSFKVGNTYSMIVFGIEIDKFEYAYSLDGPNQPEKGLIFNKDMYVLDPYAKAVTGQSSWGVRQPNTCVYKARVVFNDYDWGNIKFPHIPMEELIIYELHVRGFTEDLSSGVKNRGTFEGIREKIPYLKELGVNAVELMPIFEFDEMGSYRNFNGEQLYDYWGYNTVCFFAPNTSYESDHRHHREGTELKKLIRDLKSNGIEVILDVVFNHTAEGNEKGPFFSFKGLDNNIYYMLSPDGRYYNFSGCGNALNCNHPIVRDFIKSCLRYWVTEYKIDGFRFDLASILGRNEDGTPMEQPPLLKSLAFDPILGKTKLIAEAWDAAGLYQVGSFPSWNRWSEWNGRYRDDLRRFLKGDGNLAWAAANRLTGSKDLYDPSYRGHSASVNFLTCHDGFTLYDMYAYNEKHNYLNGWDNTDGANDNNSWNCGFEGETSDPYINSLRRKLVKNAFATLMCSRGPALFLAGDEFCNTQFGNNNAYCQDNLTSWLDWSRKEQFKDVFEFAKYMIAFRKRFHVITKNRDVARCTFPPESIHGTQPWKTDFNENSRMVAVMYAGMSKENPELDEIVYFAINAHWEDALIELPSLPTGYVWKLYFDTGRAPEEVITEDKNILLYDRRYRMSGRTVLAAVAEKVY
ncbi:glycogen debranching protein [Ruminococcus sp. JE7B6]|uniref:glycogen debranching protein n=1 Tax=Ruminococcus sp. JE7B6 TaxID=3233380 RepID=UPI00389A8664